MKPTPEQIDRLPKWAQAYVTELETRVVHLEGLPDALPEVKPDLPPPATSNALTRGWTFNTYTLKSSYGTMRHCVDKGCSNAVHHGTGWVRTSSQRPIHLFSTERKAWLAAKSDFIKWAAETVQYCDKQIAVASDEPHSEP